MRKAHSETKPAFVVAIEISRRSEKKRIRSPSVSGINFKNQEVSVKKKRKNEFFSKNT